MIKSAAIKVNDKIYAGFRHHQIIPIVLKDNQKISYITQEMQGFVTDEDEFIDRITAAKIAFECGQIKEAKPRLYSEDLW
jgi:hypothetical protein